MIMSLFNELITITGFLCCSQPNRYKNSTLKYEAKNETGVKQISAVSREASGQPSAQVCRGESRNNIWRIKPSGRTGRATLMLQLAFRDDNKIPGLSFGPKYSTYFEAGWLGRLGRKP